MNAQRKPGRDRSRRKWITVLSVVLIATVAGYFLGLRQSPAEPMHRSFAPVAIEQGAPLARSNRELASHPWSDDRPAWVAASSVPQGEQPVTPRDELARASALSRRAERRAFEGAPPVIVHPVGQSSAVECLACHETGARIGKVTAPRMSHPKYTMCTQCHVVGATSIPANGPRPGMSAVPSDFVALRGAQDPYRWTSKAPPQTPHTTNMRESCISCHGPHGPAGLQTSHPERLGCQQCHTPSRVLEQVP